MVATHARTPFPWWLLLMGMAATAGLAHSAQPLQAAGLVAAGALALTLLVALARRFGAAGLWMLAIPASILAGELGRVGAGGQSGRLLVTDFVVAAGAAVAVLRSGGVVELPRHALITCFACFLAWSALGLPFCGDPLTAVAELKEWLVAALVLAAALRWAQDAARARLLLAGIVLAAAAVALGMAVVVATHPAGPVLAVMMKLVDLPWGRSNYLAGILIVALPLALGLAWSEPRRTAAWGWFAAAALCALGLALSASKGAMLALTLTALPAFATAGRGLRRASLAAAGLLALLVLAFVNGPLRQVMLYRLADSALAYSASERLDLYRLAWQAFASNPLFGIGLNNFSVQSHVLRGLDTVPHQMLLGWLAEVGLPGAIAALGVMLVPLVAVWRLRRAAPDHASRALASGMLAAWAGALAHNQVESTVYGEQYKVLLVLLAAAILAPGHARAASPSARG